MSRASSRLNFTTFIDKALLFLLVAAITYGSSQIESASHSIQTLNQQMAAVLVNLSNTSEVTKDHEGRLRALEYRTNPQFNSLQSEIKKLKEHE